MAPTSTQTRTPRVRVSEAFPELLRHLPADQARVAGHYALATIATLEPGKWRPDADLQPQPGHMGLLVVDGLMTRDVVLGNTIATELVGRGDVLRPIDHDGGSAPVPFDVDWRVLQPTRIALLDREFAGVICHWPEAVEVILQSAVRRAHSLGLLLAVCHLRRVHVRLHVLMWHMADRWGKVTRDGVHLPVKLTHQLLGRLVGAQRPSVTTALKHLVDTGLVTRNDDGTWMLHGDPPDTLERMRESADVRCGEGNVLEEPE
jgi:CRP-like cAMP-binding protein